SAIVDFDSTESKMRAMRIVGVPYTPEGIATSAADAREQAHAMATAMAEEGGIEVCSEGQTDCGLQPESELVALIAYLQRLGQPGEAPAAEATADEPAADENETEAP
ncbi:MAG: cbb3-type cytochrome c oxidase subunit II, partial [Polyangiales bacterium]